MSLYWFLCAVLRNWFVIEDDLLSVHGRSIWWSLNERQYRKVQKFVLSVNFIDTLMLRHRYNQELHVYIHEDVLPKAVANINFFTPFDTIFLHSGISEMRVVDLSCTPKPSSCRMMTIFKTEKT
jgi:hypothetical protein